MGKHETSEDTASTASAGTDEFWEELNLAPVEIALPTGSGITLRHYRTVILPPEEEDEEPKSGEEEFDEEPENLDDVLEPSEDEPADEKKSEKKPRRTEELELDDVLFLGRDSTVYLFDTPEALVEFLGTAKEHSLSEIEHAERLGDITPEMLTPAEEDKYELDLVVRNLRGGRDAWDPELLITAAEGARDLAQAAGLEDVQEMLSAGSPIDNLDNALRNGGFWSRRRIRKMNEDTLALTWRGVIGKLTHSIEVKE